MSDFNPKEFWLESARMALFGVAGALAAAWVIHPKELKADLFAKIEQESHKAGLELKKAVVDDFLVSSYTYVSRSYDVVSGEKWTAKQAARRSAPRTPEGFVRAADLGCSIDGVAEPDDLVELVEFEPLYDAFRSDRNRMQVYFGSPVAEAIERADHYLRLLEKFRDARDLCALRSNNEALGDAWREAKAQGRELPKHLPEESILERTAAFFGDGKKKESLDFFYLPGPQPPRVWDWRAVRKRARAWLNEAADRALEELSLASAEVSAPSAEAAADPSETPEEET